MLVYQHVIRLLLVRPLHSSQLPLEAMKQREPNQDEFIDDEPEEATASDN